MAGVIRVSGKDRQRTIDLLCKNDAGELMRQGNPPEREKQIGALTCGGGPSVGWTDGKHDALSALISHTPEVRRKLLGGVLLAAAVQQNGVAGCPACLAVEPIKHRSL